MPILDHTPGQAHVDERLRRDLILWLTSVRPDGRPHIVPVWFYWDGESLLVLSQPNTQKIRNLRAQPLVSVALDNTNDGHDVIILEGEATLLPEPASTLPLGPYLDKYAALLQEMQWEPSAMVADYSQAIRIRPTRLLRW
jgi:PPOX class probable F420-dependent enzyme